MYEYITRSYTRRSITLENKRKLRVVSREEMQMQEEYSLKLKAYVARFASENGRIPLAYIDTYGCQQNVADSQNIRGLCDRMGFGIAGDRMESLHISGEPSHPR